ncbi:MAG: hypothetical protein B7Z80_03030 [Rhodospirillales bacterium 20-64-7]|nr:MAG: hypothetical protein B7Z80_03030 [Rhodospirillales bacterium 20-64-7]
MATADLALSSISAASALMRSARSSRTEASQAFDAMIPAPGQSGGSEPDRGAERHPGASAQAKSAANQESSSPNTGPGREAAPSNNAPATTTGPDSAAKAKAASSKGQPPPHDTSSTTGNVAVRTDDHSAGAAVPAAHSTAKPVLATSGPHGDSRQHPAQTGTTNASDTVTPIMVAGQLSAGLVPAQPTVVGTAAPQTATPQTSAIQATPVQATAVQSPSQSGGVGATPSTSPVAQASFPQAAAPSAAPSAGAATSTAATSGVPMGPPPAARIATAGVRSADQVAVAAQATAHADASLAGQSAVAATGASLTGQGGAAPAASSPVPAAATASISVVQSGAVALPGQAAVAGAAPANSKTAPGRVAPPSPNAALTISDGSVSVPVSADQVQKVVAPSPPDSHAAASGQNASATDAAGPPADIVPAQNPLPVVANAASAAASAQSVMPSAQANGTLPPKTAATASRIDAGSGGLSANPAMLPGMQATAAPSGAAPADASTPALPPQVAAEQTQALLAARLARAMRDGQTTLSVELHPIELGRVEVHLSFHSDGVGVQMTVDRRDTFDAFSRDRAGLEQQFSQAGIDLGSGGLDLRFGQQSGQPAPRGNVVPNRFAATATQQIPARSQAASAITGLGLVDITA